MSFFNSFISGAADACHFISTHSGDIGTAATVIANVASAMSGSAEVEVDSSDGNLLPILQSNIQKIHVEIPKAVGAYVQPPQVPSILPEHEHSSSLPMTVGPIDLQAVFPDTSVVNAGQAIPLINADINKLLSLHDLPTSMGTGQNAVDVGMSIGEKICTPANPLPTGIPYAGSLVAPPTFTIGPDENGLTYTGGFVYYQVPIQGRDNGTVAWHGQLRLYARTTALSRKAWAERKRLLAVKGDNMFIGEQGNSYNSTTVSASWTSAVGTDLIMSKEVTEMKGYTGPPFTYTGNYTSDGQTYSYQWNTSPDVGPTAVLQAFQTAIKAHLPLSSTNLPTMPVTKVMSQSTIIVKGE